MSVTKPVQPSLADFELGEEIAWGTLATVKSRIFSGGSILSTDR